MLQMTLMMLEEETTRLGDLFRDPIEHRLSLIGPSSLRYLTYDTINPSDSPLLFHYLMR